MRGPVGWQEDLGEDEEEGDDELMSQSLEFYSDPRDAAALNLPPRLDVFDALSRTEWDTLLFFYGAIACVGGLGVAGYPRALTNRWYGSFGPDVANVALGVASAAIDNIPMTYAVLQTDPLMTTTQWLLLTLTAGVGGSLLSVGSAAGVGLMGVHSRCYTFRSHLKWTPAVALGYLASVIVHLIVNGFE